MERCFVETKEEGKVRTHCRCMVCKKPITDVTKANVLWSDGKLLGFVHHDCDDKKLADNANLRDWLYQLMWASGQSDEDYAEWCKQEGEYDK